MSSEPMLEPAFLFGPFVLLPTQRVLLKGGERVKIGGRAWDLLHLLVLRAGAEVSKSELISFAWPAVLVDEQNLKVNINSLRRALQDTLPRATYVATVVGRGYQFIAPVQERRVEVPTLAAAPVAGTCDLPPSSPLVARQRDIEQLSDVLRTTGLVTLVGPGGVGKTSLAIEVAHAMQAEFADGVCFIDLSATDDPALLAHVVATSLGVRAGPADLMTRLVEHFCDRRALVVLDNCEHVLQAAAAIVGRLVQAQIRSAILATSREGLRVATEYVHRVEPLEFPNAPEPLSAGDALTYGSVELFAKRALERADYHLLDSDLDTVARLCAALDGLPLAIEIAAAALATLTPAEILASVGPQLGVLDNRHDSTHQRHRTLWAMLAWSHQLLSHDEAALFELLSVFVGYFEWADVVGMSRLADFDPYRTTVALGGLVAKSLLTAEFEAEQPRYRLLESARHFAADRLRQSGDVMEPERRHAQLTLAMLERSETEWPWLEHRRWRANYVVRVGDLRKALDWSFGESGDASLGVDLATAAIRLWNEQSSIVEQLFQVTRALEHDSRTGDGLGRRATLAVSRAWSMTLARRPRAETESAWNSALRFADLSGQIRLEMSARFGLAVFLIYTGRNQQAVALLIEAKALATKGGDRASSLDAERLCALARMHLGELIDVRATLERLAGELQQGIQPSRITRYKEQRYVSIHTTLAFSSWLTGSPEQALVTVEEMVHKTTFDGQLMGQAHILALVALPLSLWSGRIDDLERYVALLRGTLDSENIALWEPIYRFYQSYVLHLGGTLGAVDEMRSALDEFVQDGYILRAAMHYGILAESLLRNDQTDEANVALQSAMNLASESQEDWCLPELQRIHALILASQGNAEVAIWVLNEARVRASSMGACTLDSRINGTAELLAPAP